MRILGVAAVAVLVATGCAEEGVYLEVVATGMTDVELFVVERQCDAGDAQGEPCTELQPADFSEKQIGDVFIRAQDEGESWIVRVENGSAWFRFGLDPTFPLQRVVAVGRVDGMPRTAVIADNIDLARSRKVIITLEPIDVWEEDASVRDQALLTLWGDGRCVGVRDPDKGTFFIVTKGDPDCDQVPSGECDPLAYKVDDPRVTACVTTVGMQCVLGTSRCSETMPTADPCTPSQISVDPDVCTECARAGAGCILGEVEAGYPRVVCNFFYDPMIPGELCPDETFAPATLVVGANLQKFCATDVGIGAIGLPLGGFSSTFDEDPSWVKLISERQGSPGDLDCLVKLRWEATDNSSSTPGDRTLLMRAPTNNVSTGDLLPLFVNFEEGCQVPSCTVLLEDPNP